MHKHRSSCMEDPRSALGGPVQEELTIPPLLEDYPCREDPEDEQFRADLVARVRRAIARGEYDTPERWEAALDRLLQRLESE